MGPGDIRVTLALAQHRRGRRPPFQVHSIGHGVSLSYRVGPDIENALAAWTQDGILSDLLSPTRMPTDRLQKVLCRAWITAPNETMPHIKITQEAHP